MSLPRAIDAIVNRYASGPAVAVLVDEDYSTRDIVREVLHVLEAAHAQVQSLGPLLRGATARETAGNIWAFVRQFVRYDEDPEGIQAAKTPARTLADEVGDCKSMTILTAALLRYAGLPVLVRFTAYAQGPVTHVYAVTRDEAGNEIAVDPVMKTFSEKKYLRAEDHVPAFTPPMPARVAGIGAADTLEQEIDAERRALLARIADRQGANPRAVRRLRGRNIALKSLVLAAEDDFSRAGGQVVEMTPAIAGPVFGNVLARLLSRVIFPKIAPAFLYVFVDDATAAQLPAAEQQKRRKQVNVLNTIIAVGKLKRETVMKLLRNGVMKKLDATPEQAILAALSAPRVGTVAAILAQIQPILKAITPVLRQVLPQLVQALGVQKNEVDLEGAVPDLNALSGQVSAASAYQASLNQQVASGYLRPEDVNPANVGLSDNTPLMIAAAALAAVFVLSR